jgi:DnaJ homolog subfamily C member 3
MIIRKRSVAIAATLLFSAPFTQAISPSDIPADTPVSSLIASAKSSLAGGNSGDALTYFDAAVSRDPQNYLTIFQRGATYLSLGKDTLAKADFNKVLEIKPDFEGALLQRAKLHGRNGDWKSAKKDYKTAGKKDQPEYQEIIEAEKAANVAYSAEKAKDWEGCVTNAGAAILVAGTNLPLRQLRARCRFERGEVQEGVSDLQHVLQLSPGSLDPHLQISSMLFYSIGDTDKGLSAIKKCLHSDPDSKPCKKLHRSEKNIEKKLKKARDFQSKKQYNSASKLLVGNGEDTGIIAMVQEDIKDGKAEGRIHPNSPNDLYSSLVEMTCECYVEVSCVRAFAIYH